MSSPSAVQPSLGAESAPPPATLADAKLGALAIQEGKPGWLPDGSLLLVAVGDSDSPGGAESSAAEAEVSGLVIGQEISPEQWQLVKQLRLVVVQNLAAQTGDGVGSPGSVPGERAGVIPGVADGDLLGLAEALADVLGGPVVIEDARFNVLAYSTYSGSFDHGRDSTILGRKTPREWVDHLSEGGTLDRLASTSEVVEINDGPREARRRFVGGIRHGGEFLGLLWVAEGDSPLPADVGDLLKRAATVTAAHVVHYESHMRERATSHASLVKALLEGVSVARTTVEELGLRTASRHAVIALRAHQAEGLDTRSRARLVDTVTTYCRAFRWNAAPCAIGDTVYVIVDLPVAASGDPYLRVVQGLAQGLLENCERAFGGQVIVAVSDPAAKFSALPELVRQVDHCLEFCERAPQTPQVVTFQELRKSIALDAAADAVRRNSMLAFPELDTLRDLDRDEGTVYIETLGCYLRSLGSVRLAAEKLGIHITTLRYRLTRIQHIAGIDVQDAETRQLYSLLLRERGSALI